MKGMSVNEFHSVIVTYLTKLLDDDKLVKALKDAKDNGGIIFSPDFDEFLLTCYHRLPASTKVAWKGQPANVKLMSEQLKTLLANKDKVQIL